MKLHLDEKALAEAIQATSQNLKIREVFIEKDYWVCFVLKNLSKSKYKSKVVFKGGTSLSKAYKAIDRFSEDIDLAIVVDGENDNQIKKIIKEVESELAIPPLKAIEKHGVTSKHSRFRKTVWEFEKSNPGDYGDASPDLLLEINSFNQPFPHKEMEIRTYIAEFLKFTGSEKVIENFGLGDFQINVLDYKRTFTEKISAIARACYESDANLGEMKRKIRHIYDIAMLMRNSEIQDYVKSGDFSEVLKQVQKYDAEVSKNQKASADRKWQDAIVFKNPKSALRELKSTYDLLFSTLVFDVSSMPKLDEIEEAIRTLLKKSE